MCEWLLLFHLPPQTSANSHSSIPPVGPHRTTHSSAHFPIISFWSHWRHFIPWKALKAFLPWKWWGASWQVLVRWSLLHVCMVCLVKRLCQMPVILPRIILASLHGVWKCLINITTSQIPIRHNKTSRGLRHFQDTCLFFDLHVNTDRWVKIVTRDTTIAYFHLCLPVSSVVSSLLY